MCGNPLGILGFPPQNPFGILLFLYRLLGLSLSQCPRSGPLFLYRLLGLSLSQCPRSGPLFLYRLLGLALALFPRAGPVFLYRLLGLSLSQCPRSGPLFLYRLLGLSLAQCPRSGPLFLYRLLGLSLSQCPRSGPLFLYRLLGLLLSQCPRSGPLFLYRLLGLSLSQCPRSGPVREQLQELLDSARGLHEADREGLSLCFGICARNHLEETLEKLEEFVNSDAFRKSQGLFSIFKERSEAEQEKLRAALVLCYGRVAAAAPPELLRARLEPQLLQRLLQHAKTKLLRSRLEPQLLPRLLQHAKTKVLGIKVEPKDPVLKLSLARSVSMISQALACGNSGNSSGNNSGNFGNYPGNGPGGCGSIARKAELVALMVEFLRAEPPEAPRTRLRQRALSACAHLVALEPPLSDSERSELLDAALGSVLALPPPEPPKNRQEPPAQVLWEKICSGDALGALSELLRGLLRRRLSPGGLREIFA
ncbi:maestro heat-like repeat-containing protein family member 1, partial [Melozone crissalis]|uniref:maestro heat-like repeat-containing protein family member 1 n=1 Tax=Melozone crissalis TaxID=40204 RepID=UPI0023D9B5BB